MANIFRNEIAIHCSKGDLDEIIDFCFSEDGGRYYFDFEKIASLGGKSEREVWGCDSEAFNFEVTNKTDLVLVFRFDTLNGVPHRIVPILLDRFKSCLISHLLCCEMLSCAVILTRISNRVKPLVVSAYKGECSLNEERWINDIGLMLWGYSERPSLAEQGFIDVGGGHFVKAYTPDEYESLYQRFKPA